MFFVFLALFGSVSTLDVAYPVHREDYIWNGGKPLAAPHQAYSVRPSPGVYRVSRRDFLGPYPRRPYPYYQPPPPPPPLTQYYVPALFVPAANQVFNNPPLPTVIASLLPSTHRPIQTHPPETADRDETVLSATRGPSADEAEPLAPLSEHSNRVTKHPNEYFSYNEDVEITAEQMDLLAPPRKPSYSEAEKLKTPSNRPRRQAMFIIDVPSDAETEPAPLPQPGGRLSDGDTFSVEPPNRVDRKNITVPPFIAQSPDLSHELKNNEIVDGEDEIETKPSTRVLPDDDISMITTEEEELQSSENNTPPSIIACEYREADDEELKFPVVLETEKPEVEVSPAEQLSASLEEDLSSKSESESAVATTDELEYLVPVPESVRLSSENDQLSAFYPELGLRCFADGCVVIKEDDAEEEKAIPEDALTIGSTTPGSHELSEDGEENQVRTTTEVTIVADEMDKVLSNSDLEKFLDTLTDELEKLSEDYRKSNRVNTSAADESEEVKPSNEKKDSMLIDELENLSVDHRMLFSLVDDETDKVNPSDSETDSDTSIVESEVSTTPEGMRIADELDGVDLSENEKEVTETAEISEVTASEDEDLDSSNNDQITTTTEYTNPVEETMSNFEEAFLRHYEGKVSSSEIRAVLEYLNDSSNPTSNKEQKTFESGWHDEEVEKFMEEGWPYSYERLSAGIDYTV